MQRKFARIIPPVRRPTRIIPPVQSPLKRQYPPNRVLESATIFTPFIKTYLTAPRSEFNPQTAIDLLDSLLYLHLPHALSIEANDQALDLTITCAAEHLEAMHS